MESGGITISADVAKFFEDVPRPHIGRHRTFTETERAIIKEAYEKGYRLTSVAKKLNTTLDSMRKCYETMK